MAIPAIQKAKRIMVIALLAETLSATYMLSFPSLVGLATVLYTLAGLTIGVAFLFLPSFEPITFHPKHINHTQPLFWYKKAFLIVLGILAVKFSVQYMEDAPMDYHDADMLPIMKIMCQRFLCGKGCHVYDIIPEIWNGIQPVYFPAMWMPYCIAVFYKFDLRWITMGAIFSAVTIFFMLLRPFTHKILSLIVSMCVFITLWWLLTSPTPGLIPYTEEGIVIFYYTLLAVALFTDNFILIGIAISLCALSRYALAGWLPAMLIYLIYTKQFKGLIKVISTGIICFVFLMLIPFGWPVLHRLISLPGEYIDFAKRVWNDSPEIFDKVLGFAKYFGVQHINLQHKLLISLSLSIPSLCMIVSLFLNKTKKRITLNHLPIATLKIGLAVFYSLIDVPYLYLFYTALFFSFIMVVMSLREPVSESI